MFDDLNEGGRTPGDGELGPKLSPEPVAGSPGEHGDSKALPKAGLNIDKRLKRPMSKRTGGPSSPIAKRQSSQLKPTGLHDTRGDSANRVKTQMGVGALKQFLDSQNAKSM